MLSTSLVIIASLVTAWGWPHEEMWHRWTCPGENIILECPPGQVIDLLALDHGENATADCDTESQFADISPQNCFHWQMIRWAKFICDDLERCRLPKPSPRMFICGGAENFFVRSTYLCKDKEPGARSIEVCDHDIASLQCEEGNIRIVTASYGRFDEHACSNSGIPSIMTFCASSSAETRVENRCDGREQCEIPVHPAILGRPRNCDNGPKYLKVDYVCE